MADKKKTTKKSDTKAKEKAEAKIKDLLKYTVFGNIADVVNTRPVPVRTLQEAVSKPAVFTFGRMNPPTAGHERMVDKLKKTATTEGGTPYVYLSHANDRTKNPLPYDQKFKLARKAFGTVVKHSSARRLVDIAKELNKKHRRLVMVVGSDRIDEFRDILIKYNGNQYDFDEIKVVSGGDRDPDAADATGMSASKVRDYASGSNMNMFTKGLPTKLQGEADSIMKQVRHGMNLTESHLNEDHISDNDMRKLEDYADRMFGRFDIDAEFRGHFIERLVDARNDPEIGAREIASLLQKMAKDHNKNGTLDDIMSPQRGGQEFVVRDKSSDINIVATAESKRRGDELRFITTMRKKYWRPKNASDIVLTYEQYEAELGLMLEAIETRRTIGGGMAEPKRDTKNAANLQNRQDPDDRVSRHATAPEVDRLASGKAMGRVGMDMYKEMGMTRDPRTMSKDELRAQSPAVQRNMAKFDTYKQQEKRAIQQKQTSKRGTVKENATTNLKIRNTKAGGSQLDKAALSSMEMQARTLYGTGKSADRVKAGLITTQLQQHRRKAAIQGVAHKDVYEKEQAKQLDEVFPFFALAGMSLAIVGPFIVADLNSDMVAMEIIKQKYHDKKLVVRIEKAFKEFGKKLPDDTMKYVVGLAAVGLGISAINYLLKKGKPVLDRIFRDERYGQMMIKDAAKRGNLYEDFIMEATYQGEKVKLNDPIRNSSGNKKFRVYTTDPKTGNVIKVQFGDPGMSIKRDSDKNRKAFRSRHGCDALTFEDDRDTPKYWSCRMWEKGTKVSDLD